MAANDKQVGGQHYAAPYQHWDLVADIGMGYFAGNITKYVTRHSKKNGAQDLEKALHYIDKYMEVIGSTMSTVTCNFSEMKAAYDKFMGTHPHLKGTPEEDVLAGLVAMHGKNQLAIIRSQIQDLLGQYPPQAYVNQD